MGNHTTWSLSLGRWGGLNVRLHVFFLLFAVCTLFLSWKASGGGPEETLCWIAAGSLLIVFVSVVLHELGHYFAAVRWGGGGDELVVGPLVGMSSIRPPHEPYSECLMHLAGPLVNLAICLVLGALLATQDSAYPLALLHPLAPSELVEGPSWLQICKLTFWINWIMLLANLLPAFPFDGGRALRAALTGAWPDTSPRKAGFLVSTVAKIASVGLLVLAWMVREDTSEALIPPWFALVLFAIFLYFSAKQEEERSDETDREDEVFGYDFSQGYTSLERSTAHHHEQVGPVKRWFEQRRRIKERRQHEIEADEERRVDEILSRLHQYGMESLSEEDRSVLQRVSARYRDRPAGSSDTGASG